MGQSSSQVAPSQVPGSARSFMSKVMPWDSTSKQSNKRSRPASDDEEETRIPKKRKHDEMRLPKERKANKAVPQHRRGTSIKPQEIEVSGEAHEVEENENDKVVVATPASKNKRSRKHAATETGSRPSPAEKKRKKAKTSHQQEKIREAEDAPEVSLVCDESAANLHEASKYKDGVTISANGRPGPKRRRKEKKNKTAKSSGLEHNQADAISETQSQPSAVRSDGVDVSAVGDPGPKRKKKTKPAATHSQDAQFAGQVSAEDQTGDRSTKNKHSRAKAVKDSNSANGVTSEPRSASRLPTPSEEEEDAVDQSYGSNEEDSEDDENDDASAAVKPKRSKKTQKPAKTTDKDLGTEAGPTSTGPVNSSTMAEEKDTRPVSMKRFQTAERGTLAGPWTTKEHQLADKIFHDFCRYNNISGAELKDKTTKWVSLGPLKTELYEAFPKRSLELIRKHMQRRYSPYEKGQWSEEETQRLKDAHAKYPDQWAEIAKEVGRGHQACRDRWVNLIKYEDTMDRGAWSIAEEAKLVKIVEAAVALIVDMTDDPEVRNDRVKAEAMLNWTDVANRMDGKRSPKRCIEKWKLLKRRSNKPKARQNSCTPQNYEGKGSRKKQDVERHYAKMRPGDIYDVLHDFVTVLNCIPPKAYHQESTFWSVIAGYKDDFKTVNSIPLVRHVYLTALVTYNCKNVRRETAYNMKTAAIMRKMMRMAEKGELDLEDRYSGVVEDVEVAHKKSPKKSPKKKTGRSDDVVHSSDDDTESAPIAGHAHDVADADDELVVPETQSEQVAGAEEESGVEESEIEESEVEESEVEESEVEESEVEDEQSVDLEVQGPDEYLDAQSLRSETPHLTPEEFMEKCKQRGKEQHRAFLDGYGR